MRLAQEPVLLRRRKAGQVLVDGAVVAADIGEQGVGEAAGDEGDVLAGSAVEVLGGGDCGCG